MRMNDFFKRFKNPVAAKIITFLLGTVVFWSVLIAIINGLSQAPKAPEIKSVVISTEGVSSQKVETPQVAESQSEPAAVDDETYYKTYIGEKINFDGFDWAHTQIVDLGGDERPELIVMMGRSKVQIFGDTSGHDDYSLVERDNGDVIVYGLDEKEVKKRDENPKVSAIGNLKEIPMLTNPYMAGSDAIVRRETFLGTLEGLNYLFVSTRYEAPTGVQQSVEGFRINGDGKFEIAISIKYVQQNNEEWLINGKSVSKGPYQSVYDNIMNGKNTFMAVENMEPDFDEGLYEIMVNNANVKNAGQPVRPERPIAEEPQSDQLGIIMDYLQTGIVFGKAQLGAFTVEEMIKHFGPYASSYKEDTSVEPPVPYFTYDFGTFQTTYEAPEGIVYSAQVKQFAGIEIGGSTHKEDVKSLLGSLFNEAERSGAETYLPFSFTTLTGDKASLLIGYDESGIVTQLILTMP